LYSERDKLDPASLEAEAEAALRNRMRDHGLKSRNLPKTNEGDLKLPHSTEPPLQAFTAHEEVAFDDHYQSNQPLN